MFGKLALGGVLFLLCAVPASAIMVTNTFTGTVIPYAPDGFDAPTTNDIPDPFVLFPNGPFGGGGNSLIGMPFTLKTTVDTSVAGNTNFFVGSSGYNGSYPYGGYYFCCNAMTATLTINGHTRVLDDHTDLLPQYFTINSDGFTSGDGMNPGGEFFQQAFYWDPCCGFGMQYMAIALDLNANVVIPDSFSEPLPKMLFSNGDFAPGYYAAFYTWGGGYEVLNLGITGINAAPEPVSLSLFGAGLAGAGWVHRRRKRRVA